MIRVRVRLLPFALFLKFNTMEEKKELQKDGTAELGTDIKMNRHQRRQLIFPNGVAAPKRPFNNRANTSKRPGVHSRTMNQMKKRIYAQLFGRK